MPDVKTVEKPGDQALAHIQSIAAAPIAAAEPAKPALQPGHVWVRILPKGDKRISTGETKRNATGGYDVEEGVETFPSFPRGAITQLPLKIAQAQEDNGYLEIQES
jgi:hypothetical protein